MDTLVEQMKKVLAETFALYLKAHNYHWNVEGPDFPQYHEFFGNFYEEVYGAVDRIAEEIRALGSYAPGSFGRFKELSAIQDETSIPDHGTMVARLIVDNTTLLNTLNAAYKLAEQYNEIGLSNFLQDRYDAHKKHAWMLKSILVKAK